MTQDAAPGAPSLVPTLRVLFSGTEGVVDRPPVPLAPGAAPLGRAVDGPLRLRADPRAGAHHATLLLEDAGAQVRDNHSRNGTFVNGRRVKGSPLADGDLLRLGDSFLLFRHEPQGPEAPPSRPVAALCGVSPALRALRAALCRVAPTDLVVTLIGEPGVGKLAAAQAIHELSGRAGPLLTLHGRRAGKALPDVGPTGTLCIDEVADLDPDAQAALLSVLAQGWTRVIATSKRDLAAAVEAGGLRADLPSRLQEITLRFPPLRSRREDILPRLLAALGEPRPALGADLVAALLHHAFPYNDREVDQLAGQLRVFGDTRGATLDLPLLADRVALPQEMAPAAAGAAPPTPAQTEGAPEPAGPAGPRPAPSAAPDKEALAALLTAHQGNLNEVAAALRCNRRQVYRWLERHALRPEDYRRRGTS